MKQLSLNLPTITMTNNFSSELSRIVKNKRCVIFTSKFWSNNDLLNAFKKNINILDIIDDIEPNPKLNGVFKKHLNIDDVDYIDYIY